MPFQKISLRVRIFISMILLVLLASILIAAVTIYQYQEEAQEYHESRLERKEEHIKESIKFVLDETTYEVTTNNLPLIFRNEIFKISAIHDLEINLFSLDGKLLKSSRASVRKKDYQQEISQNILNTLSNTIDHRYVDNITENGIVFQSSYSYVTDEKSKTLAILNIPYLENDDIFKRELNELLLRLGFTYLVMIFVAIVFAYFISKYITSSLKTISEKMNETRLEKRNKKIEVKTNNDEIASLIKSYNSMIDDLESSAVSLAASEREQAWREMAKQVAHEIKNPLTPMRLTVQSFQRKFNPNDEDIEQKIKEYSNTLIQQIDTLSSIASAFSNFAKMPAQQSETLNVVKIVKLALDIFNENYIAYKYDEDEIIAKFDRTQLIRVVTNLVKNSIQAIPKDKDNPLIEVKVFSEGNNVVISVTDNGLGILEKNKSKVFEPKFTTKTSGMGLGLAMVKNIIETFEGSINFVSEYKKGTTFKVKFPKA